MDINIQNLLINPQNHNLLKDYQSIFGIITSSVISIIAMLWANKKNEERWQNDGYLKRKIELEILIRKILLKLKELLNNFPQTEIFNNLINNELTEDHLECLNCIISYLHSLQPIIKDLKQIPLVFNHKYYTGTINDDYNIKPLLDEYIIFKKNEQKSIGNFLNAYYKFLKEEIITYNDDGGTIIIGISNTHLKTKFKEIKNQIINIFEIRKQTNNLLKIIEENFETNKKPWWQVLSAPITNLFQYRKAIR